MMMLLQMKGVNRTLGQQIQIQQDPGKNIVQITVVT